MVWVFFVSLALFTTALISVMTGGPVELTATAWSLLAIVLLLGIGLRARERHFARETWGQAIVGAIKDGFSFLVSWV